MVSIGDFDVFRRPPADLHERGTASGSVLTLASFICFVTMVTSHLVYYWTSPQRTTEMRVQQFRKDRVKISLILDIAMPCPLIDLEVHDVHGTHTLDAARNMRKQRVLATGASVAEEVVKVQDGSDVRVEMHHYQVSDEQKTAGTRVHSTYFKTQGHDQLDSLGSDGLKTIGSMVNSQEWCRFNGSVLVAKMPGKLFVRAHHAHLGKTAGQKMEPEWYNTSHVVRKMTFLDKDVTERPTLGVLFENVGSALGAQLSIAGAVSQMMGLFGGRTNVHPMSLTHKIMSEPHTNWRYDLQVVGHTDYDKMGGLDKMLGLAEETYDYTMGAYSYRMHDEKSTLGESAPWTQEGADPVSISYSFSPITVVHRTTYQSCFEFVRSLLGTLGGCFAVMKLLDNSLFLGRHIQLKSREGKLS